MLTLQTMVLGAKLFYWLYLLVVIFLLGLVVLYTQRERIKKAYYYLRWPEQCIKLNIVWPGNLVKRYYRLIPDLSDKAFTIGGKAYNYNDKAILKDNDFYATGEGNSLKARVDGKEYNINKELAIRERWDKWPELWYNYDDPWPIDMSKSSNKELQHNASDFARFKESKKLNEIYSALTGDTMTLVIMILVVLVILAQIATMGKVYGWWK